MIRYSVFLFFRQTSPGEMTRGGELDKPVFGVVMCLLSMKNKRIILYTKIWYIALCFSTQIKIPNRRTAKSLHNGNYIIYFIAYSLHPPICDPVNASCSFFLVRRRSWAKRAHIIYGPLAFFEINLLCIRILCHVVWLLCVGGHRLATLEALAQAKSAHTEQTKKIYGKWKQNGGVWRDDASSVSVKGFAIAICIYIYIVLYIFRNLDESLRNYFLIKLQLHLYLFKYRTQSYLKTLYNF